MGRVKTRLGHEIGAVAATRFYRACAVGVIGRLARDPRFETILAIDPAAARRTGAFDSRVQRVGQCRGDLGARMQNLLETAGPGPVIVIGTDIPGITSAAIVAAFRQLGRHDVVIGPAEDGGFWLIGYAHRRRVPRPFTAIGWSRADTRDQVVRRLDDAPVGLAATLADVDSAADHRRLGSLIGRRVPPKNG